MINKSDIEKIQKIAIEIDHDAAFGGKSKGNMHLFRVVKIALFLCEKLKADRDVVEVAAYLHDASLPTKNDDDYTANKKLIREILVNSGASMDESFISRVCEAAASHEGTVLPITLEAKIIHDADVIEKTGLLGIIRHTWKLTNHDIINPNHITDEDIIRVTDHIKWRQTVLQTDLAKEMALKNDCPISMETLRKIIPAISKLASESVITEIIAKKIEPLLNKGQIECLTSQLMLRYLK